MWEVAASMSLRLPMKFHYDNITSATNFSTDHFSNSFQPIYMAHNPKPFPVPLILEKSPVTAYVFAKTFIFPMTASKMQFNLKLLQHIEEKIQGQCKTCELNTKITEGIL